MPKRGKYILKKENPTAFKKGHKAWNYKGESVGYKGLHDWVKKYLGRPNKCSICGKNNATQWANKSHLYKRDLEDWIRVCVGCHINYDRGFEKAAIYRFGKDYWK